MHTIPNNKISKLFNYIKKAWLSRLLLALMHNGYLIEIGWFNGFKQKKCLDEHGEPIPWSTYPYINYLKENLTNKSTVFEFGSGYSTLFFQKRVHKVYTVEHNIEWTKKMNLKQFRNVTVLQRELDESYEHSIQEIPDLFDYIIIDGRRRVNCIKASINKLKETGILVLDDSERDEYNEGIQLLFDKGFKRISFWGITPHNFHNKNTSIFFKRI